MATSTETYSQKYARSFLRALDQYDTNHLEKTKKELEVLSVLAQEPLNSFFSNPIFDLDEKKM